jgi:hypothetical protein
MRLVEELPLPLVLSVLLLSFIFVSLSTTKPEQRIKPIRARRAFAFISSGVCDYCGEVRLNSC